MSDDVDTQADATTEQPSIDDLLTPAGSDQQAGDPATSATAPFPVQHLSEWTPMRKRDLGVVDEEEPPWAEEIMGRKSAAELDEDPVFIADPGPDQPGAFKPDPVLSDPFYDGDDPWTDDDDWTRLPRRSSKGTRLTIVAILAVAVFGPLLLLGNNYVQRQLNPPGEPSDEVVIEIPEGAGANTIAGILADEGIVPNKTVFRYYLRNQIDESVLRAGIYTFQRNSAAWDVKNVLEAGPAANEVFLVTIVEGLRKGEIAESLLAANPEFDEFELELAIESGAIRSRYQPDEVDDLEGLMFPDTYQLDTRSSSDEDAFISRLVGQFDSVGDSVGLADAEERLGLSPYDVIVVASLIEEEIRVPEERPLAARVMYNRLAAGDRLGIDATVYYAIGKTPDDGPLTRSDLAFDSPYNTRLNPGLPPGPIAAPSRASLEAAMNPAEGDWYYYVLTDESGSHTFTVTEEEFLEAVEICRDRGLGC